MRVRLHSVQQSRRCPVAVVFVTGAAGFLGVNTMLGLAAAGHEVAGADIGDRMGRLAASVISLREGIATSDLAQPEAGSAIRDCDAIIHLAALAHVDYSVLRPVEVIENNVSSTLAVLEAARHSGARVVLASSVEVYQGATGVTYDENALLKPHSPYGSSKVAMEQIAESYRQTYGMEIVTLRFTNLYGPWQAPDRVIPRVLAQQRLGVPTVATPSPMRDFLHVADAVAAIEIAVSSRLRGAVYNVSTGRGVAIDTLLRQLRGDADVRVGSLDSGRGEELVASPARFVDETGWSPSILLDDGLEVLRAWNAEHEDWLRIFDGITLAAWGTPACLSDLVIPLRSAWPRK